MRVWMPLLIPALIAGACLLVSWGAWRRRNPRANGHWGGAIGIAAAFLAAYVLLLSWPGFPPASSAEWLVWSAFPFAALGAAQRWWGMRWYAALPVRLAASAALCYALLQSPIENRWGITEGRIWWAGATIALTAMWTSFEALAAIRGGASIPLSAWAWCAISAVAFTLAGSGEIGQMCAALAAAWGAGVVISWWAPGISFARATMTAFVPLYFGLLMRSHLFSELTPWSAGLLYAAPFALWYGEQRRFRFSRPWKSALVRAGLIAAPALIAVGIEWWLKMGRQEPAL